MMIPLLLGYVLFHLLVGLGFALYGLAFIPDKLGENFMGALVLSAVTIILGPFFLIVVIWYQDDESIYNDHS